MTILTAEQARALTVSREQQIESFLKAWREVFNTKVTIAAQGSRSTEGKSEILYDISAASEILRQARDAFMDEIRGAGYKVHLHDSDDEGDYFVYKVSWGMPK
jgi:type IV pilus biogenesis protein CpaD/CtpE